MTKIFGLLICLIFCLITAVGVFAKETESVGTLPAIVAQICGQANTVVMWHDINDDGKPDYKATYVFKDGRLHQLGRNQMLREEPVRQIQER